MVTSNERWDEGCLRLRVHQDHPCARLGYDRAPGAQQSRQSEAREALSSAQSEVFMLLRTPFLLLAATGALPVEPTLDPTSIQCPPSCRARCQTLDPPGLEFANITVEKNVSVSLASCAAGCDVPSSARTPDEVDEYCHDLPTLGGVIFAACKAGVSALRGCEASKACALTCESEACHSYKGDVLHPSCVSGCHVPAETRPDGIDEFCQTLTLLHGADFHACKAGAASQRRCMERH